MMLLHLTASRMFGGPERQMLGLAEALPARYRSAFVSFWEDGECAAFLDEARERGFDAATVRESKFRPRAAVRELEALLRRCRADVLISHGYKANLLGLWAARRASIPALAVSRGWTAENWRVRTYEELDRLVLRRMDHVVCVSEGQRTKVLQSGVRPAKTSVIHNAVRVEGIESDAGYGAMLRQLVPAEDRRIVCSVGRLSPEKGFGILVEAARLVAAQVPDVAFIHFGDGPLRASLESKRHAFGLSGRLVFAGFRKDARRFLPHVDVVVLPSFTEGLPNVALEACAAGKPIVATRVGGTPEIVRDGVNGLLVPAGDPGALAEKILTLLASTKLRHELGAEGRALVEREFTFASQSRAYRRLLQGLVEGVRESTHPRIAVA